MAPMLKGILEDAPKRAAYVTFLAGSGDYWKGVVGLAKGLRVVNSAYPLVVAVLPDVPELHRRILIEQGCLVREIEPVYPPESQTQFAMAYYVINYSKLRIWEFVEYERMVYLDADIQVYSNIDHLFDLEKGSFYAVMDCFCEKTWSHTPQYKIGYCQQCPDRVAWPERDLGVPPPPLYFNAGMFVHEPSLATAKALLDRLVVTDPTPFAEQDFLNMFFRDVYKPIPPVYNLVLAMLWRHPENVQLEKVKVVHYCAATREVERAMAPMLKGIVEDSPKRVAYVTFLAGSGDYWKGVVGLAKGLRAVNSAYPLVVAVLPDVPEDHRCILLEQGCLVREIEPVYPPESQTQFAMAYYVINYSKLRIWEFVEYERMVYLDADIQVYDNIDHLFDLEMGNFYAVMDCFCEKTWSHTLQYKIGYCQQCPHRVAWPERELGVPPPPLYFNAGMFVHEPSLATAKALLDRLVVTDPTPFAEQDFLNMFFRDAYKPIPPVYNLVLAMLWRHPENVQLDKVKVVHYCAAGSKPWRFTGEEANMDRDDIKMLVNKQAGSSTGTRGASTKKRKRTPASSIPSFKYFTASGNV